MIELYVGERALDVSPRRPELLDLAYRHVLAHGLADLSLRPLARAIGSSPRVLLYLFGSKSGLVRAILDRARRDELAAIGLIRSKQPLPELRTGAIHLWGWVPGPEP